MVGWGEEKEGGEDSVSEQQLCTCRLGGASRQHDCSWESECPNLTHQECRSCLDVFMRCWRVVKSISGSCRGELSAAVQGPSSSVGMTEEVCMLDPFCGRWLIRAHSMALTPLPGLPARRPLSVHNVVGWQLIFVSFSHLMKQT